MRAPCGGGWRARARLAELTVGPRRAEGPDWWHHQPAALGVAAAVVLMILLFVDPAVVIAGGAALTVAGIGWRSRTRGLAQRHRREQFPEALERIAAALRSGASLPQALRAAGAATPEPLGGEVMALARESEHGRPVTDVLDRWVASHDELGTRLAATALALAAGVGAAPARAVDGVAATLRERNELAAERRTLATQARSSAVVLSVAPVGFALLLGTTDRAAARFLLRSPGGWTCLAVGLGLDAVGAVWMIRLVRAEEGRR
jgi:tight adherence protein B